MNFRRSASRYAIGVVVSACLFGVVNYFHLTRHVTCFDCFFPYGLPFTFFRGGGEGGYAGRGGFEWVGAALDLMVVLTFGAAVASVWHWFPQKHQS
jgi:hypothetical protein